jgi:hypothetical protein
MQRILVSSFLVSGLLFVVNVIHAQKKTSSTPEERAAKLTEWMKTNLQLNGDQATQVQTINLKYANKTQGLQTPINVKERKAEGFKR